MTGNPPSNAVRVISRLQDSPDSEPIHRAKWEWEGAVDCMAQLILVLDSGGKVIRANRATETWGFGKVEDAQGVSLHGLLHPTCSSADCSLGKYWENERLSLSQGYSSQFEFVSQGDGQHIKIDVKPACPSLKKKEGVTNVFAIAVIDDVTDSKLIASRFKQQANELEDRVRARTEQLERTNCRLVDEIESRKRIEQQHQIVEAALRESEAELRALSMKIIVVQELERKRISGDLHDGLGQSLSLARYCVEDARRMIDQGLLDEAGSLLTLLLRKLADAMSEVRRITMDLRPSLLDDLGILATISWLTREYSSAYKDIQLHQNIAIQEENIPNLLKISVYRILQEAMNNTAKHAAASELHISLNKSESAIELRIRDNGKGFALSSPTRAECNPGGFGLGSMHDRAALSGGVYVIESSPGRGTSISISWPLS
jgi:signal transduction histidine kinase